MADLLTMTDWTIDRLRERVVRYGALVPCRNAFIDTRNPGSEENRGRHTCHSKSPKEEPHDATCFCRPELEFPPQSSAP